MSWPCGLTTASFKFLVPRAPTIPELQAALDAQDFLERLTIDRVEPVEVQSDTPPLYEWRGLLDGKDMSFRIGTAVPARLPGPAKDDPSVRSWPLALWSTNAGDPDVVAAGAMSLYAWTKFTRGAAYSIETGAIHDLTGSRRAIDVILTRHSGRWDELVARYPDFPLETGPKPGEEMTISIRVL